MNFCKHLKKKVNNKLFCKLNKENIELKNCKECKNKEYKEIKKYEIKKKSKKLKKMESKRYSIITDNLENCWYCKTIKNRNVKKDDLHEIYGGRNRTTSIKNGLVVPLCRQCHEDEKIVKWLKRYMQEEYEKKFSHEKFLELIGKNYKDMN